MKKLTLYSSLVIFGIACSSNIEIQEIGKSGITRHYTLQINQNNQDLVDYLIHKEKENLYPYLDEELRKNKLLFNLPALELIKKIEDVFPMRNIEDKVLDFHKTFFPQLEINSLTNNRSETDNHLYSLIRYKLLSEYVLEKFTDLSEKKPTNIPVLKLTFIYLFKRLSLKGKKMKSSQKKKEMKSFEEIFSNPDYITFTQNLIGIKNLKKGLNLAKENTNRYSWEYKKIHLDKLYCKIKK